MHGILHDKLSSAQGTLALNLFLTSIMFCENYQHFYDKNV